MNGAETSRVQEHSFAFQEPSAGGDQISTLSDESEDSGNIVHRPIRMVRKYPEESEDVSDEPEQALMPTSRTTCICPEVLNKGTLVAIIGSLAFLGFFSTLVLLLASVIILRLMDRQSKKEKKDTDATKKRFTLFSKKKRKDSEPPKRPIPPIPRRPSEHVYLTPMDAPESSYVDPKELHPGPRIRQEGKYVDSERRGTETKSIPEGYISMQPGPFFSTSPPEKAYTSVLPSQPFSTSTPEKAYSGVLPAPDFSLPSPEHVYASIHDSQVERSYTNVDEPQSEFMADASRGEMKGPEEHIYEEIN